MIKLKNAENWFYPSTISSFSPPSPQKVTKRKLFHLWFLIIISGSNSNKTMTVVMALPPPPPPPPKKKNNPKNNKTGQLSYRLSCWAALASFRDFTKLISCKLSPHTPRQHWAVQSSHWPWLLMHEYHNALSYWNSPSCLWKRPYLPYLHESS